MFNLPASIFSGCSRIDITMGYCITIMLYCSFQLMDIYMAMQCAGTVWFARPDALKVSSLPLSYFVSEVF